jgi:hypothetical protein
MPPLTAEERRRQLIVAAAYLVNVVGIATTLYFTPFYWKQPYHMSKSTGAEWVQELIVGHHDRIGTELGVRVLVFLALAQQLHVTCHLKDGRDVSLNEQVVIFLYMCATGLSIRHVAESIQCSKYTISM